MHPRSFALIVLAVAACSRKPSGTRDAFVLSCDSFSVVTAARLRSQFGTAAVTRGSVPLGDSEGDMVPATILFADEPSRRAAIVWRDTLRQRSPRYVYLNRTPAEWRTPEGIAIGTSLRVLEQLNQRPFHLAGFGFDESGSVTSWDGGRLERFTTGPCRVHVWLDSLAPGARSSAWYRQVLGDGVHSSHDSAMQKLEPRVSQLLLYYP